jgi:ABC-2 type transport system ATP-binding protein
MITTKNLTKRFEDTTAVDSISIQISKGEIYGFLGPNGAGKTTTMRMLTGLTQPTSGSAKVAGTSISDRARLVEKIGHAPDTPPLYEQLTGWEQIQLAADIHGVDESGEKTEQYLDRFDMLEDADSRISSYPKGMKQKINVIQTIIHSPPVVFLDEPTGGLDPRAASQMEDLLTELANDGTTVFLSTHILDVAERVVDTVGVLYEGELLTQRSPERLVADVGSSKDSDLNEVFLTLTAADEEDQR